MPLEQAGIEYVSANFGDFIKNIGDAAIAITKLGRMTENRLAALRELGNILEKGSKGAENFAKAVGESTGNAKSEMNGAATSMMASANQILGAFMFVITGAKYLEKEVGGVFKGISKASAGWAALGGAAGAIIGFALGGPALATAVAPITAVAGSIMGAFTKLIQNITKAVVTALPKAISSIVKAGISIGKAIFDFGKSILSAVIKVGSTILSPIKSILGNLLDSIFGMFGNGGASRGGWRSLGGSIFTAMFKFEALKQIVRGLINEIKSLASSSFNAAVELQTLTIRLDNLIAMQVRGTGITEDYGQSIKIAGGYTQELLRWVEKMALATPVSVEDIANTVSLSIAMGWTVKSAKELTKAILDYTVGQGLSSEVTERIIYNFAQMKQQGKVTGTELRDLGRGAFMPINKILREMYENVYDLDKGMESATMSFAQFKEEAAAGKVPVEEFFTAFEDFVGTNLPNAAERMNFTFAAVRQNISDLFKIMMGWNVLGPVIESVTKPIQSFVNSLKSDEALAKANAIGKSLAYIVDTVKIGFVRVLNPMKNLAEALQLPKISIDSVVKSLIKLGLLLFKIEGMIGRFITSLIPFAKKIGDEMGGTFDKMGDDFFGWGINLIYQFAKGLIIGATKFITAAINFIAKMLTSLFITHSPPKILPEIDKWGMNTINEWLHGMTQADFDILNDMKGSVKSALDALVAFGVLTDEQAMSQYLNMSIDLIRAMDELNRTGTITIDVFQNLRNIGGAIGQEVTELLDLQIQHAIALERVEAAQRAYDEAVKATQTSHAKASGLIKEYNKMLRQGADRRLLKNKLKIVNTAEIELDVNRRAELAKKDALDVAKEQLKIIEEQVKLQESLIRQLTDLALAQKDVASGAAGAAEDIENALENLVEGLGGLGTGESIIDWDALKKQAEEEFRILMNGLEKDWKTTWFNNISSSTSSFQIALDNMKVAWAGTLVGLKAAWNTFAAAVSLPSWEKISAAWNTEEIPQRPGANVAQQGGGTTTLLDRFQNVIKAFTDSVNAGEGGIPGLLGRVGGYIFTKIKDSIISALTNEKNKQAIVDAFNAFMTWVTNLVLGYENVTTTTPEGTVVTSEASPWATRLGTAMIEGLKTAASNAISSIDWSDIPKQILLALWLNTSKFAWTLVGDNVALGILQSIVTGFSTYVAPVFQSAWDTFIKTVKSIIGIKSPASTMIPLGVAIVDGLAAGITEQISAITWDDIWNAIIDGFKLLFGISSESTIFKGFGVNIIDGLKTGLVNTLKGLLGPQGAITIAINNFINGIKGLFGLNASNPSANPFYTAGQAIVNGIIAGFNSMIATFVSAWNALIRLLPDQIEESLLIRSPSKVMKRIGRDVVKGLALGITDSSWIVEKALGVISGSIKERMYARQNATMQASPVYGGSTLNFGDVNINNGMDFAVFKAMVQKAIIEG
jgi:hypothetical protein